MISSEERQEIAERLRHAIGLHSFLTALDIDTDSEWNWMDVSDRVAELIDPTCRIVSGDADNHMPHCNLCGTGNFDLLPKYCKGCGARIVYNENVN